MPKLGRQITVLFAAVIVSVAACKANATESVSAQDCSIAAGGSASNNSIVCQRKQYFVITDESVKALILELTQENQNLRQANSDLQKKLELLEAQEGVTRQQLLTALNAAKLAEQNNESPAARFNYTLKRFRALRARAAMLPGDPTISQVIKLEAARLAEGGDIYTAESRIAQLELHGPTEGAAGPSPPLGEGYCNTFDEPGLLARIWYWAFPPAPHSNCVVSADVWLQNQYGKWVNIARDTKSIKLVTFGYLHADCTDNLNLLFSARLALTPLFDIQGYYITFDNTEDTPEALKIFADQNNLPIQLLRGETDRIVFASRIMRAYHGTRKVDGNDVQGFDFTDIVYVFDRHGDFVGVVKPDTAEQDIIKVLNRAKTSSQRESAGWIFHIGTAFAGEAAANSEAFETQAANDFAAVKPLIPSRCKG